MEKSISEVITYEFPITEFECTKKFLKELKEKAKELNKAPEWEPYVRHRVENGLEIVFRHVWDVDTMVFKVYMGFAHSYHPLHCMGTYDAKSIEALCETYEKYPNSVFARLDWSPTEEVVEEFLSEFLDGDLVYSED